MNLTKQDIEAVCNLAKEAQTLRNEAQALRDENAKLRQAALQLHVALWETATNIDVSTINQSKRSQDKWGRLRVSAMQALVQNKWLMGGAK